MSSYSVPPPRLAAWLVSLFANGEAAESIVGDLLEEYSHHVLQSGVALARRWYWRQTIKSAAQLAGAGFCTAPWSTSAAIAGGFLLRRFAARWVEPAIFGVLHRYDVFERHFDVYRFLPRRESTWATSSPSCWLAVPSRLRPRAGSWWQPWRSLSSSPR